LRYSIKHPSLAVKNAFIYLILILFSSFLIGYSIYRVSEALIISSSRDQIKNEVQNVALKMTTHFDHVGMDIHFLANSPLVSDYIKSSGKERLFFEERLTKEFKVLLESKPSYFQVRLIGIKDQGKELIRVDRKNGIGEAINADQLQQKGDRNYFTETIKLRKGSIYFSEIDLNKEFGKIEIPYTPTLRVASPLYIGNILFGIVIINTDLRSLFNDLKKTVSPKEELFIFNSNAYFLMHPDETQSFGFEFGQAPNVKYWFSDLNKVDKEFNYNISLDSVSSKERKMTLFYTLRHPNTSYKLFIAISTTEKNILYPFISWKKNTIWLTLGITFAFLGIAFWWMRSQSKELKNITRSMVRFSEDYSESKLVINNADEIGELAKAFTSMAGTIRLNIHELQASKEVAIKANQSKEEFLENMSHEIRNPLQSILGMTNILEQNHPRPDQSAVIKTIQFSSKQLLSLVNDILDFSKIRIGEIQLKEEIINLDTFLKDMIRSHLFFAQSKKIILDSRISPELKNLELYVDPLRLSQVLNNLIVNAIKFTPSGGSVLLTVDCTLQAEHVLLSFAVSDTGTGIASDELDKIKNRYYSSASSDIYSNLSGAGLGLPIVIQLLKLFKTELAVQSELNIGSRFSFNVAFKMAKSKAISPDLPIAEKGLPQAIQSILCVEDDPQILYFFSQLFKPYEKELILVENVNQINELSPSRLFDVILTDSILGTTHLINFLPTLVSLKAPQGIIIVCSGTDQHDKINSSNQGFIHGFVQKPVIANLLLSQINQLWNSNQYSSPVMTDFFKDYDYKQELVQHGLEILIDEWKSMKTLIIQSLLNQDQETFNNVFHKIITTLRRFKLDGLLGILHEIQMNFVENVPTDQAKIEKVDFIMERILANFEHHLKELSSILKAY
ncbi:MAG: ATP-binding protein, partial [Saprospiraceae bacterium]